MKLAYDNGMKIEKQIPNHIGDNSSFLIHGQSNVYCMKTARHHKEAFKLMQSYRRRLEEMNKEDTSLEIDNVSSELEKYPNHLLTKVKALIVKSVTGVDLYEKLGIKTA